QRGERLAVGGSRNLREQRGLAVSGGGGYEDDGRCSDRSEGAEHARPRDRSPYVGHSGRQVAGGFDQRQTGRFNDRLAPARGTELSVRVDRLRLDRVTREEEVRTDLPEGEVSPQQRQQTELRAAEPDRLPVFAGR